MDLPEDTIEEVIEQLALEGEEAGVTKEAITTLASNIMEKGMLPKDAMGLSQEMVDGLYSFAYRLYNTGKYDQAMQLFRLLIMLDPTMGKYMLGLAACFHMQKEYEEAATCYILCSLVDDKDPIPHYHTSDCYMQLGKNDLAIKALEVSIDRMGNQEVFEAIRERAQATLDMLHEKTKAVKKKPKTSKKAA